MSPRDIYKSHTRVGLPEVPPTAGANGNGWRKVPMPIFMAVTGVMFTVICSLVAWTWSGTNERQIIAKELASQFEKQASAAAKVANDNFALADQRMNRIQNEINGLRDLVTRHIEMDKPGR